MRYYFPSGADAWAFALNMSGIAKIVDYGVEADRMVNQYYVEVGE